MPLLKPDDIRRMSPEERKDTLGKLRNDLMYERGVGAMGGAPPSPGKIRAIRTNIARLLTIENESKREKIKEVKK
ncbi:MAG: 50S ribosomal protein L29 [Candidatus Thermoplasmatota archaeon]